MRLHWFVLGTLLISSVVRAETVAVLDLGLGDVASVLREQVATKLKEVLGTRGQRILLPAEVKQLMGGKALAAGCRVGPCLSVLRREINADRVLVGRIEAEGSSYDLTLTLLEADAGSVLAQVSDHCDVCTFEEAGAAVGRATLLLRELACRQLRSQSWLVVRTKPPGAEVWLDGVPLGKAPLRRLVAPGARLLRVESRRPAAVAERRLALKAGNTEEVDLTLSPGARPLAISDPRLEEQDATQHWGAWLTLGTGLTLGTLGTVLLGLHDDCRDEPECTRSRETRLPGLILAGAGLVSTAVSGLLFWREIYKRSSPAGTAVGLVLGPKAVALSCRARY